MLFNSVDEVLDFAISNEEEAYDFYMGMAAKMSRPEMKKVFEDFAKEEKGHRAKLLAVKKGAELEPAAERILDLKIGDYLVSEKATDSLDYQGALVLAMKKEKAAFRLYTDLAGSTEDEGLRNAFLALAQEEAKHKLRFELEYDDHIYNDW